MNKPAINIQDAFLYQVLKSGQALSIELVSITSYIMAGFARFSLRSFAFSATRYCPFGRGTSIFR